MNDKVKFVHMLYDHFLMYNFRGLRYDACLKGVESMMIRRRSWRCSVTTSWITTSEVCFVSLFDRGFAHNDKSKLVEICPIKSLDYPNVAQASFIQTTLPRPAAVDWKKVAAKAFSEEDDAAEWEEVTLESLSDEYTVGEIVTSSSGRCIVVSQMQW